MPRPILALRALLSLVAAAAMLACGDLPAGLSPLGPDGLLSPRPHAPTGQQPKGGFGLLSGPRPSTIAVAGLPASDTLTVGDSATLSVSALDSAGTALEGISAVWLVSDSSIAAVDSASGVLHAVRAGQFRVGVSLGDTTAWVGVTAVDSTVTPPTPEAPVPTGQPAGASSVALSVVRFDGGSGAAVVSTGVPLPPGALRPGDEGTVRLAVAGVERPVYVRGLWSRHPDGSLRSVLVQFEVAALAANQLLEARLDVGGAGAAARAEAMTLAAPLVEPGARVEGLPLGLPQAAALPSDPAYLMATGLVGPTISSAAAVALGGPFARYEADFAKYAESFWARDGAQWDTSNYYDRALVYYAMWVRTGNPTYWARAAQLAADYRAGYLEANAYGSSPHWAQLEGLEKHYLLTGDEKSRTAVLSTAQVLAAVLPTGYMNPTYGESRIAARVLHAQLLAWRLSPAGSAAVSFQGLNVAAQPWGANVEAAVAKIAAWQRPDGSYPADIVCGGQLNYMVGMLNDALIKTYDYYAPASGARAALQGTIQTLVQRAADYLWNTQWVASSRAFQYASVDCNSMGVGDQGAAPDLNNLISTGYGWLYRQTDDARYRTEGDAIFNGGVTQAYLAGTKQFNQEYTSSFRYLGYR